MNAATKSAARFLSAVRAQCADITTLATRNSDALDFHLVAVWNLRAMIRTVAPKMSDKTALAIVRTQCPEITTLAARNSDSADMHELAVWTIQAILRNAATFC